MNYQQYRRMKDNELALAKENILLSIAQASGQQTDALVDRLIAIRQEIARREAIAKPRS
jgi:hypothetical protein